MWIDLLNHYDMPWNMTSNGRFLLGNDEPALLAGHSLGRSSLALGSHQDLRHLCFKPSWEPPPPRCTQSLQRAWDLGWFWWCSLWKLEETLPSEWWTRGFVAIHANLTSLFQVSRLTNISCILKICQQKVCTSMHILFLDHVSIYSYHWYMIYLFISTYNHICTW